MPASSRIKRPTDSKVDPEVIEAWSERQRTLAEQLTDDPDGAWAWLWSVRLRILDFLIQRHGTDNAATLAPGRSTKPNKSQHAQSSVPPIPVESTRPYDRATPYQEPEDLPLDDAQRRRNSRLASLHKTNEGRRARQRPIKPTPPPYVYEWKPVPYRPTLAEKLVIKSWESLPLGLRRTLLTEIDLYTLSIRPPTERADPPDPIVGKQSDYQAKEAEQLANQQEQIVKAAKSIAAMDERGYKQLRQIIAIDLGLTELTDEVLDEETIRAILAEHGLEPDETE